MKILDQLIDRLNMDAPVKYICQGVFHTAVQTRHCGLTAINSLIDVDDTRCDELNAAELIIDKGYDRKVAIIGHFPFVDKVRKKAKSLWVIEKHPKPGDLEEDKAAKSKGSSASP